MSAESEMLVVESIYPDVVESKSSDRVTLRIPVDAANVHITLRVEEEDLKLQSSDARMVKLLHLPPIILLLMLSSNYPNDAPPCICSITSMHSWMSPYLIQVVEDNLKALWRPNEQVLCSWIDYILSGEFLRDLGGVQVSGSTARILSAFSERTTSLKFLEQAFTCLICQTSVKGSRVIQLSCGHVTCRDCLSTYWSYTIREGDIDHTCCPAAECVKQGHGPSVEELQIVLTPEVIHRWQHLRDKRLYERDPATTYCPIPSCQSTILAPAQLQNEESGWTWLRTCPRCDFSFCAMCRKSWHGPHTPCANSVASQVVHEYLASGTGSSHRLQLERQYGQARLRKLVAQYEEDQLNQKILTSSTMICPGCKIRIEKSMGCNHITCLKCKQHFCYLCGDRLDPTNPYFHFGDMGSACYQRLFSEIPDEVPAHLLVV